MPTRLTTLAEPTSDGRWQCGVCQWRCTLAPGEVGRCLVRAGSAEEDGIVALADGLASAATVGAIEEHRLWHFFPGTPALSFGSYGYSFPVDQQRGAYATPPEDESKRRQLDPDRVAQVALDRLCRGVVWAYSEPAVSVEYLLDLLRTSRASSRYTAIVTSGYMTIEALDSVGRYLDGLSIEIRGFDDAAYRRLAGVEQWRGVLDVAAHALDHWRCHIEITTRLHPGVNDGAEQVQGLAGWIRDTLGAQTPWHLLAGDAGTAAAAAVARARRIAHEAGLTYVYGTDPGQSTVCSSCNATLIERKGQSARVVGLDGRLCASCQHDPGIRTSIFKR
jgi:pyruvate formate lyase activating enzyme